MVITCEKEFEDYICNNTKNLIKEMQKIYDIKEEITLVGRQIKIGNDNIADLIFNYKEIIEEVNVVEENFIIVELKFRELKLKDLAQVKRYKNVLENKIDYNRSIQCLLIGTGCDGDFGELLMEKEEIDDVKILNINTSINYYVPNYSYKDEYIENVELDERIKNICEEV